MLLLYCLVEKKDKYILDVALDVIIAQGAVLIMDTLYILLVTNNVWYLEANEILLYHSCWLLCLQSVDLYYMAPSVLLSVYLPYKSVYKSYGL